MIDDEDLDPSRFEYNEMGEASVDTNQNIKEDYEKNHNGQDDGAEPILKSQLKMRTNKKLSDDSTSISLSKYDSTSKTQEDKSSRMDGVARRRKWRLLETMDRPKPAEGSSLKQERRFPALKKEHVVDDELRDKKPGQNFIFRTDEDRERERNEPRSVISGVGHAFFRLFLLPFTFGPASMLYRFFYGVHSILTVGQMLFLLYTAACGVAQSELRFFNAIWTAFSVIHFAYFYVTIHVAFYNEQNILIYHPLETFKNYFRTKLLHDFLRLFPFELIAKAAGCPMPMFFAFNRILSLWDVEQLYNYRARDHPAMNMMRSLMYYVIGCFAFSSMWYLVGCPRGFTNSNETFILNPWESDESKYTKCFKARISPYTLA